MKSHFIRRLEIIRRSIALHLYSECEWSLTSLNNPVITYSNADIIWSPPHFTSLPFTPLLFTLATATASATSVPVDTNISRGGPSRTPLSVSMYAPNATPAAVDPSRVGVTWYEKVGTEKQGMNKGNVEEVGRISKYKEGMSFKEQKIKDLSVKSKTL